MKKKYTLVAAVLILMILLLSLDGILKFTVDYQWFKSLGYLSVYFTKILAIIKFMIPMFILCFVVIGLYYRSLKKSYLKEINRVELDPITKKRESKIFILVNIICHHSPYETSKLSCNCCFCNIIFLAIFQNHLIIAPSQTLICPVCIIDYLR